MNKKNLSGKVIVVCREEQIRCKYLSIFFDLVRQYGSILVAMPKEELIKGSRGWAKAQILLSFKGVEKIVSYKKLELKRLKSSKRILFKNLIFTEIKVESTNEAIDLKFMEKAKRILEKSQCWWRPTACVLVRGNRILCHGYCCNLWRTKCQKLSLKQKKVSLASGERISFCNDIHSEIMAISSAAKKGISLKNTTAYLTVCPCEECAKAMIVAGVKRVVFDKEYYDREGLRLLKKHKVEIAKIKDEQS